MIVDIASVAAFKKIYIDEEFFLKISLIKKYIPQPDSTHYWVLASRSL